MARLTRLDHGVRRATGALGVRACRIEPEPEGHAERVLARAVERDRAVDAAAHRHRDPIGARGGAERGRDGVRDRIRRERLARNGGRFEEAQPRERALHAGSVRLDDAVALDEKARDGEAVPARGVTDELDGHRSRLPGGLVSLVDPACSGPTPTGSEIRARVVRRPNRPQGHSRVPVVTLAADVSRDRHVFAPTSCPICGELPRPSRGRLDRAERLPGTCPIAPQGSRVSRATTHAAIGPVEHPANAMPLRIAHVHVCEAKARCPRERPDDLVAVDVPQERPREDPAAGPAARREHKPAERDVERGVAPRRVRPVDHDRTCG